jgi:hypothetical protein
MDVKRGGADRASPFLHLVLLACDYPRAFGLLFVSTAGIGMHVSEP